MRVVAGALAAMLLPAAAGAYTSETRDAPWRLTGIAKDRRTLKVVYEGSGCLRGDGQPVVDETAAGRVTVRVRQTVDIPSGPYEACTLPLIFYKLDVPLATRLGGRFVRGGPRFEATSRARRMPRVVGLRRRDAVRALQGQELDVHARGTGVVYRQRPKPGAKLSRQDRTDGVVVRAR